MGVWVRFGDDSPSVWGSHLSQSSGGRFWVTFQGKWGLNRGLDRGLDTIPFRLPGAGPVSELRKPILGSFQGKIRV